MVGRASPVLSSARAASLGALLAALCAWDAFAHALPAVSDRFDVAIVAVVLLPATFAVVWLLLDDDARRPAVDRRDVDERDHRRDEHDP